MAIVVVLLALVLAGGGAALLLGGGSGSAAKTKAPPTPSAPEVTDLTASVRLFDNTGDTLANPYIGHAFATTSGTCKGRGSWSEFSTGHTADLTDSSGNIVASADLGDGTPAAASDGDPASCLFTIQFASVPSDLDLFTMRVADHDGPTFHNGDLLSQEVGLEFNRPTG